MPVGLRHEVKCLHVKQSIDLFHGRLTWPGSLSGEQITKLRMMTAAVLTTQQEGYNAWLQELDRFVSEHANQYPDDAETHAFLKALTILLKHRPSDLPWDNRYNAYLVAIRNEIQLGLE